MPFLPEFPKFPFEWDSLFENFTTSRSRHVTKRKENVLVTVLPSANFFLTSMFNTLLITNLCKYSNIVSSFKCICKWTLQLASCSYIRPYAKGDSKYCFDNLITHHFKKSTGVFLRWRKQPNTSLVTIFNVLSERVERSKKQ